MTPIELLAQLRVDGLSLSVNADGLWVGPASRITGAHRQQINAHKNELIGLLWDPWSPGWPTASWTPGEWAEFGELVGHCGARETASKPVNGQPPLQALTVCQPWAWAICHGPKRVENRVWRTDYRGLLLIHAGKSKEWLTPVLNDGTKVPIGLSFGAIVGAANLVACLPANLPPPAGVSPAVSAAMQSPFAEGPVCWVFDRVWPATRPIPCPGAQQLWPVPEQMRDQLRAEGLPV